MGFKSFSHQLIDACVRSQPNANAISAIQSFTIYVHFFQRYSKTWNKKKCSETHGKSIAFKAFQSYAINAARIAKEFQLIMIRKSIESRLRHECSTKKKLVNTRLQLKHEPCHFRVINCFHWNEKKKQYRHIFLHTQQYRHIFYLRWKFHWTIRKLAKKNNNQLKTKQSDNCKRMLHRNSVVKLHKNNKLKESQTTFTSQNRNRSGRFKRYITAVIVVVVVVVGTAVHGALVYVLHIANISLWIRTLSHP